MNTPLILKIADMIERNPIGYNQCRFGIDAQQVRVREPECDSPCCVIGWASFLTGKSRIEAVDYFGFSSDFYLLDLESPMWPLPWFSKAGIDNTIDITIEDGFYYKTIATPTSFEAVAILRKMAEMGDDFFTTT